MDATDYKYAKRNPESRQEFLDYMDMERYIPFVENIRYLDNCSDMVMRVTHLPSFFSYKIPSSVEVSSGPFNNFSWIEFYSVLVHHEGFHAEKWNINPMGASELLAHSVMAFFGKDKKFKLWNAKMEVEAYGNQIYHPSFNECSSEFKEIVRENLYYYKRELKTIEAQLK